MNRRALCLPSTSQKLNVGNNIVSKPLKKGDDKAKVIVKSSASQKWNLRNKLLKKDDDKEDEVKLVERLEKLEKHYHEVKAELEATKGLLENAIAAIEDLKTGLATTKEEFNNFKTEVELTKLKKNLQPNKNKDLQQKEDENPQPKEDEDHQPKEDEDHQSKKDEDHQPKENKQDLQQKENKAHNEEIKKPAVLEINDVDLHNAYEKLPYDSLDELKNFKQELRVLEIYIHIKSRLLCIGGDGVTEWITAVLNAIMTTNLQGKISLTGKGTDKGSLLTDYKQVANLIHDVVRSANKDYKDKNGNAIIGKCVADQLNGF